MRVGPWLDPALPVYVPDPVNRHHPLNRGRAAWWLALPPLDGGAHLHDLMGRYPGTLTSMGNASNGWRGASHAGALGAALATDGSAGYVDCGTPAGLDGATQAAVAGWVYKASNSVQAALGGAAGSSAGNNRFSFQWYTDGNGYFSAEGTGGPATYGYCAIPVGWRRVIFSFDGTQSTSAARLTVYVDGAPQSLAFSAAIPAALGNVGPFQVGKAASNVFGAGLYDDVSLWLRPLTAADAAADYDLSRRGYPGVLNRVRSRVAVLMGSTGGTASIAPAGIASAEAFGSDIVSASAGVAPAGVASAESFGSDTVSASAGVAPSGVASAETFGADTLAASAGVAPGGIASAEAMGTDAVGASAGVAPGGIAGGESFGSAAISTSGSGSVAPGGIGTSESFGSPTIGATADPSPAGIPSAETFGSDTVSASAGIAPPGVPSAESFGSPAVSGSGAGMSKPTSFALQSGNSLATNLVRSFGFAASDSGTATVHDYGGLNGGAGYPLTLRQALATMTTPQAAAVWGSDPTYGAYVTFNGTNQDGKGLDTGMPAGTGDRTFAFLARIPSGASNYFFGYGTSGDNLLAIGVSSGKLVVTTASTPVPTTISVADGAWHLFVVRIVSGNVYAQVDATTFGPVGFGVSTTLDGQLYFGQAGGNAGGNSDSTLGLNCPVDVAGAEVWAGDIGSTGISALQTDFWQAVRSTGAAVAPGGIGTSESFGSPSLMGSASIVPAGIASSETFGADVVSAGAGVAPAGIPSAELVGRPRLTYPGSPPPVQPTVLYQGGVRAMKFDARQLNTASHDLVFKLVSSTDFTTPALGATPAVTISKAGGAMAGPAGAVSEIGGGWYKVAKNAADVNTLGALLLAATATGAVIPPGMGDVYVVIPTQPLPFQG